MALYTNDGINFYTGDMMVGGRIATQAEIDAYNLQKTTISKWGSVYTAREILTVTVVSGHKFAANPNGIAAMLRKEASMLSTDTCTWHEDWGSFITTKVELQEALTLANTADQNLLDTLLA